MKESIKAKRSYSCPLCGKEANLKLYKEYVEWSRKYKYYYKVEYSCQCESKINAVIEYVNNLKKEYSEIDIENIFQEANNKAIELAKQQVGIQIERIE